VRKPTDKRASPLGPSLTLHKAKRARRAPPYKTPTEAGAVGTADVGLWQRPPHVSDRSRAVVSDGSLHTVAPSPQRSSDVPKTALLLYRTQDNGLELDRSPCASTWSAATKRLSTSEPESSRSAKSCLSQPHQASSSISASPRVATQVRTGTACPNRQATQTHQRASYSTTAHPKVCKKVESAVHAADPSASSIAAPTLQ
jgi:hypothetical protein